MFNFVKVMKLQNVKLQHGGHAQTALPSAETVIRKEPWDWSGRQTTHSDSFFMKYTVCKPKTTNPDTKCKFDVMTNKFKVPRLYVEIKCQLDATDEFFCRSYCLLNMFRGTIMPIIRSSRVLYRWLLPVVLGALVYRLSVWCVARKPDT